jgi:metacaspase-1
MANALSLHLGLNSVDPRYYQGWDGSLRGCEQDARDMYDLARGLGYKAKILLTKQCTADALIKNLLSVAKVLEAGDSFFLTYSGHGGQIPDTNGDEDDGLDETWVMYNRMFIDDELHTIFGKFKPGVRVTVLSDSCHSGTVTRTMIFASLAKAHRDIVKKKKSKISEEEDEAEEHELRYRLCPREICTKVFTKDKKTYVSLGKENPLGDKTPVGASVILISGCQDNQLSQDGLKNGLFTENLLHVWNGGNFEGDFQSFHKAIQGRMPPYQSPNLFLTGNISAEHLHSKPFAMPLSPEHTEDRVEVEGFS